MLVVEYGDVEYAPGIFDPPLATWGGIGASASYFIVQSLPVPDVKNKTAFVLAGKVVGGSTAINGQFFDRPSRYDFDAYDSISSGQLESVQNSWSWNAVFPFFKKVSDRSRSLLEGDAEREREREGEEGRMMLNGACG